MSSTVTEDHLDESILKFSRTDYVRVRIDHTVEQALRSVQGSRPTGRVVYFYVIDDDNKLCGVLPTRRLLLSPSETPVKDLMVTQMVVVPDTATLLDACDLFLFHKLLALPIVDSEGRLKGVVDVEIYTDEMADLIRREESNDVFQLIGVRVASVRKATTPVVFQNRFPWLVCNILGGLACAFIAGLYQGILDKVIALALFIPVVLALAESVSIQSLTLTLQAQHGRSFHWNTMFRSVFREIPVGLLLGVACGGLVALAAWAWQRDGVVALCLLASIGLSITFATLCGLLVPTFLNAAQRDPKVASGPITLAMTDLTTLFIYLGLATMLLG